MIVISKEVHGSHTRIYYCLHYMEDYDKGKALGKRAGVSIGNNTIYHESETWKAFWPSSSSGYPNKPTTCGTKSDIRKTQNPLQLKQFLFSFQFHLKQSQ